MGDSISIGEAIIAWADGLPDWQRAALRMLTESESLASGQIDSVTAVALRDLGHQPPFGDTADDAPVTAAHLGTMCTGRSSVRLTAIENPQRVNSLAPNQRLAFSPDGLTVVYGDNGSGKSGYARILKRTCGSRCAGKPILPNVYGDDPAVAAEAGLEFSIDGTSSSVQWRDGREVEPILPEIGYFDLECASIQISGDNTVLLTPPGLDLLQRFADVCARVKERLSVYVQLLDSEATALVVPEEYRGTVVDAVLSQLNARTDMDALRQSIPLSPDDEARLKYLVDAAGNDPGEVLKNCRVIGGAVQAVETALSNLQASVNKGALQARSDALVKVEEAEAAARVATELAFSSDPLPGVGTETWKVLWRAARDYSQSEAYPGDEFPVLDGLCPLCQQPLDEATKSRVSRFDAYMTDAAQAALKKARGQLTLSEEPYVLARAALPPTLGYTDAIEADAAELASEVRRLADDVSAQELFPDTPAALELHSRAAELVAALQARTAVLAERVAAAEASKNPEAATERTREIADIKAREWLTPRLDEVGRRIAILGVMGTVETVAKGCGTTKVSNLVSTLAAEHISKRLEDAFAAELAELQVGRLPVVLAKSGTRRGTSLHKVALCEVMCDAKPSEVLSEGEQKCIALAGFLAEVGIRDDESGIVFDDPVTSLDHRWRMKVARRLVRESACRQVVIFTHDIVFLMALLEEAKKLDVIPACVRLRRSAKEVGICEDGLPWAGMTLKSRLGVLRDRAQTDAAAYRKHGEEAYTSRARVTYAMLRETWERGVEELLLGGAVERLRRSVETHKLRQLSDITNADIQLVEQGMTKCSRFMVGHDAAAAINEGVPEPEELASDIEVLVSWADTIRGRRS